MKHRRLRIISGRVERRDGEDNGTTRPTWRASVAMKADGAGGPIYTGAGDGKAAHVALNRACNAALTDAGRAR